MASKALPPQGVLRQLLDYDQETGLLRWKERGPEWFRDGKYPANRAAAIWNGQNAGCEAGRVTHKGVRIVTLWGAKYAAHRLIWKIETGRDPDVIDHIDGNAINNRWLNLRDVTQAENMKNLRLAKNNTSGVVGVQSKRGKWAASIQISGKMNHLGIFPCIGQAIRARREAERQYGFHPNHGRTCDENYGQRLDPV